MSSVNKAIIIGRLGRDPELKSTPSGAALCNFSVATDDSYTDKNGQKQERTEWHRVVVWGKQAESCGRYLTKGSQVYVEGSLTTREWEQDGNKRNVTEIKAENVRFLGSKGDGNRSGQGDGGAHRGEAQRTAQGGSERPKWAGPAQPSPGPFTDDDIPFALASLLPYAAGLLAAAHVAAGVVA